MKTTTLFKKIYEIIYFVSYFLTNASRNPVGNGEIFIVLAFNVFYYILLKYKYRNTIELLKDSKLKQDQSYQINSCKVTSIDIFYVNK